ncbi:MAG: leucyl/phenylalanyl-tRNA--protein transferase [Verrucomicrobia bacterium]|nr:MAG: leucyl/phenylalanyl-tRNA--protein transferase [Verrucomicrobiota bacterium]
MPELPSRSTDVIDPCLLLEAYAQGVFPMAMEDGEMGWFSPDPRGIIPIREFHVPHGLKRLLRRGAYEVRLNTAFTAVMRGCADRESTWINESILRSYVRLFELGFAHSVETWMGHRLVGGLYGVAIGGAFFGESMFSRETGASQVALHALVRRLDERGFTLLDTQWTTEHLSRFGAHEIAREDYLRRLERAIRLPCQFMES